MENRMMMKRSYLKNEFMIFVYFNFNENNYI